MKSLERMNREIGECYDQLRESIYAVDDLSHGARSLGLEALSTSLDTQVDRLMVINARLRKIPGYVIDDAMNCAEQSSVNLLAAVMAGSELASQKPDTTSKEQA